MSDKKNANDTIIVYIPKDELNELTNSINAKTPSHFWLSKPDTWNHDDLATMNITLTTYVEWLNHKTSNIQLLRD